MRRGSSWVAVLLVVSLWGAGGVQAREEPYMGMTLAAALRDLQSRGLPLVFSSKIVTPDMRVEAEPRAKTPRAVLESLLRPHRLRAVDGPGGVIQIVPAPRPVMPPRDATRPRTGSVRGRVTDAETGSPLDGALVQVPATRAVARTDAEGRFQLAGLAPGRYTVRVSRELYLLSTARVVVPTDHTVDLRVRLVPLVVTRHEQLTVRSDEAAPWGAAGRPATRLGRARLDDLRPGLTDDPLRAVHVLPRVAATNDFRSEFSVRGSPYRHVGVVIDGVPTPWLRHTAYDRGDIGSLTMLAGDLVESTTLRAGAYPRRHDDTLGAEVVMTLREGSRDANRVKATLGGTDAAIVADGPLGTAGRGSWLASMRHSYLSWPLRPHGEMSGTVFGFTDAFAKLVYDLRPTQQLSLSVLGGRSSIEERDDLLSHALGDGTNQAFVANLAWRSALGPGTVVTQRFYVVDHAFANDTQAEHTVGRGAHRQAAYRADLIHDVTGGVLEAGMQLERVGTSVTPTWSVPPIGEPGASIVDSYRASSWLRSAYAHVSWEPRTDLTVAPGVRVTDSTSLGGPPSVSPWITAEWWWDPRWALNAGAGISHHDPELVLPPGRGATSTRPERAVNVDLGLERRIGDTLRLQATVFARDERDVRWWVPTMSRLNGGGIVPVSGRLASQHLLRGKARGVELLLERHAAGGLSGWVSYAYGTTRYHDPVSQETFWGDFDQRHALTASVRYALSRSTTLAADFRRASNFPIRGYFESAPDDRLFVSERRNGARLPAYVRLDLRASRRFSYAGRDVRLFVEVLNVLDHVNHGPSNGVISPATGEAVGFTSPLLSRVAAAGLAVEF